MAGIGSFFLLTRNPETAAMALVGGLCGGVVLSYLGWLPLTRRKPLAVRQPPKPFVYVARKHPDAAWVYWLGVWQIGP